MKKEDLEESKIDEVDEVKDIDDFDLDEEAYDEADETVEDTEEAEEEPKKEDKKKKEKDKKEDKKKEAKKDKPEKKKDDQDVSSNNLQKVIILLVLALICCGLIFVAVFLTKKDEDKNSNDASANAASANAVVNTLTLEECQANVENGTMLEITTESGATVYVYNYTNEDYINENIAVTDEEVDQMINDYILAGYSKVVSVNRADVRTGDIANIDYLGKIDGVAFDGGTGQGYDLEIGSGNFIDGFEDQLVGMQVGECKDITVTFPDDYYEELAGKEAVFTVSVNSISVNEVPSKLTDEIAADFATSAGIPNCSSAKALKDYLRDYQMKENLAALVFENYYLSDIDSEIYDAYYDLYYYRYVTSQDMTIEDLAKYYGTSVEELEKEISDTVMKQAKIACVEKAIAEKEGIVVEESDYEVVLSNLGYDSKEAFFADFGENEFLLKTFAVEDKVMEYIFGLYGLSME